MTLRVVPEGLAATNYATGHAAAASSYVIVGG